MADAACVTVTLDTVRFRTDLREAAPRRSSEHRTIGGSTTIQDFGINPQAAEITLKSGQQCMLEKDTKAALDQMYVAPDATYNFVDWRGNQFTVSIAHFQARRLSGDDMFTYEMTLRVKLSVKGA